MYLTEDIHDGVIAKDDLTISSGLKKDFIEAPDGVITIDPGVFVEAPMITALGIDIEAEAIVFGSIGKTLYVKNYGKINGNLWSIGIFHNHGVVEGSIRSKDVFLYPDSCVVGNITAERVRKYTKAIVTGSVILVKEAK